MGITGGFGTMMDLERGTMRNWVMGRDGVKRWADNNEPCEPSSDKDKERQQRETAKYDAHRALDAAEKAWHEYAALCDVGPERTGAFTVFENVRLARRI